MVKYICKKCRYKLEVKTSVPKKCPYCSSERAFKKEENAEELLSEE